MDAYVEDAEDEEVEPEVEAEEETDEVQAESSSEAEGSEEGSDSQRGRRRRRGRRGGRRGGRDRDDEPREKMAGDADGEPVSASHSSEGDNGIRHDATAPADTDVAATSEESSIEREGSDRGPARRRDRWGRNRNGRNKNGRGAPEGESGGHVQVRPAGPVETREPQPERHAAPIIAIQEIVAPPVEPRKWQPPAATVKAAEVVKPKAGWWSKRG
jgi:ribonuclease E